MQHTASRSHFNSNTDLLLNPKAQQTNVALSGPSSTNMPSHPASNSGQATQLPTKPAPIGARVAKSSDSHHSLTYLNKYARAEPKVQSKIFDPDVDLIDLTDDAPLAKAPPANVQTANDQTASTTQNATNPTKSPFERGVKNKNDSDNTKSGKRDARPRRRKDRMNAGNGKK